MKNIQPDCENGTLLDVEQTMNSSANRHFYRRLLALRLLLQGRTQADVASIINVSVRSIRRWVKSWNRGGIDALANRPKSGRPPAVTAEQRREIVALITDVHKVNQTHWTAVKLHGYLRQQLSTELGYSTLTRLLRHEGFRLKVPRPWPVEQDEQARQAFRDKLKELWKNNEQEIWFADESGFLADPRPRRIWALKGTTPTTPYTGLHVRESVLGAVNPRTGELLSLVFNHVDTDVFQAFLDYVAAQTAGRRVLLILDNATWHKAKKLNWHHLETMYLPPYSPDLNPIERLWLFIKERYFTQWYTNDRESLILRICEAMRACMEQPKDMQSLCAV
jgi:transposase